MAYGDLLREGTTTTSRSFCGAFQLSRMPTGSQTLPAPPMAQLPKHSIVVKGSDQPQPVLLVP